MLPEQRSHSRVAPAAQHEKKREQLTKLREQFEADKARIAKMKQERKFKPHGY